MVTNHHVGTIPLCHASEKKKKRLFYHILLYVQYKCNIENADYRKYYFF